MFSLKKKNQSLWQSTSIEEKYHKVEFLCLKLTPNVTYIFIPLSIFSHRFFYYFLNNLFHEKFWDKILQAVMRFSTKKKKYFII